MKYLLIGEETERLQFCQVTQEHYPAWLEIFKDEAAVRFLAMTHLATPEERCDKWFEVCNYRYEHDIGGMHALVEKTTQKLVGQCGVTLKEIQGQSEFEIGFSILPPFRNQGFAWEAAQKCRDFAFTHNFHDSLISIIHVENIHSEKVARKLGMQKEQKTYYKEMPVHIFRIKKENWNEAVKNS